MAQFKDLILSTPSKAKRRTIRLITTEEFNSAKKAFDEPLHDWLKNIDFTADISQVANLPTTFEGADILWGIGDTTEPPASPWDYSKLAASLPKGRYDFQNLDAAHLQAVAAFGWVMAHYNYDTHKSESEQTLRTLHLPDSPALLRMEAIADGCLLARDLVNAPTNHMGPSELAGEAKALAKTHGAKVKVIKGAQLEKNFPAIHAVGRAADDAPCLIDMNWAPGGATKSTPKLTLVGKGVCFDTGGLNIKQTSGMRNMKKDMGGAANTLGLAHMIMALGLDVRLRVLIPAVENSISSNAYRPGDIIATRKGLSVEITNTDAEGRVVLCDALTLADEDKPDLIIDFATLTGAARVALGPDLPALYANDDDTSRTLMEAGTAAHDPLWHMPLWEGYDTMLDSTVADMLNAADSGFAGSITAALYLKRFVTETKNWVHLDIFAWNPKSRPGRPIGGEAMSIRAVFAMLEQRYG